MKKDIIEILDEFVPEEDNSKWAKLFSTINYRRLKLALLKEILIELRKLNKNMGNNT